MNQRMIDSTCPCCQHTFWIKRDTVCVAGIHPTLEQLLDQNIYFRHKCSQCQTIYEFGHPFLFRDPDRKYVIILSEKKEFDNLEKDDELILCDNVKDFEFCFRVKRQGCSIEFVRSIQKQFQEKEKNEVFFDQWDPDNQCLWFLVDGQPKGVRLNKSQQEALLERKVQ